VKKKKPTEMYRFKKDYTFSHGLIFRAGVGIRGPYIIEDNKFSVENCSLFKDIPLDYVEKFELQKLKKIRKKKEKPQKEEKTKDESARISNRKV
jgi:hypothetical protein